MKINLDRKQIRTFGLGLAVILGVIGGVKLYRGSTDTAYVLFAIAAVCLASALFFQPIIKPVYIVAMRVAHVLGWINTRILLGLIYYLVLTPISLVMRAVGKDFLEEKLDPQRNSYWIEKGRTQPDRARYERQY